jgi:hypothetical protein
MGRNRHGFFYISMVLGYGDDLDHMVVCSLAKEMDWPIPYNLLSFVMNSKPVKFAFLFRDIVILCPTFTFTQRFWVPPKFHG